MHVSRLYYYVPSLRCCCALGGVVNGCLLAIIQSSLPLWSFEHSGPITLCACLDALMSSCHTHRYRRPRLLTQLKRGAKFENPRWRLNRSKIIDSAYEKRCFCILRPPILFPIPMNHLFVGRTNWCERFGCILVLISTIYNLKFNRARMGKDEKRPKLPAWFLFLCIPSVFYQFSPSNVIYI